MVDGVVIEGVFYVDESMFNGELIVIFKDKDFKVFVGIIN